MPIPTSRKISAAMAAWLACVGHGAFATSAEPPSARAVIRSISRDADSLKFRNEFDSPTVSGIKCGEVNGKNGFGGYVGFRRFIVQRQKALLDDGTLPRFNEAWSELCSRKK